MSKPKVFITRRIPDIGLERIASEADIDLWPGELPPPYEVLQQKIVQIDGLLCLLTDRIDADLIRLASPALKVISQFAVGFDNIDVTAATSRRIPVGNTPGVLTDATADFTWALLMAAGRRLVEGDRFTRSGQWKTWGPTLLLGPDIAHATLGIIGFGRIGQAVARRARGFDMNILYYDTKRHPDLENGLGVTYMPFDELISQSDFITLHTPLTPHTHHLISTPQFERMKSSAVLINTARGPIVDTHALYQALSTRRIAAAALDVTVPEPIPASSPLLSLDNLIIAPHIASASIQTRNRMAEMASANLLAGLRGEPLPNCVNQEVNNRS